MLIYFCKKHNTLCCAKCITKIKGKENGQHYDCDICFIEDIEEQKRNKLNENIQILEDLSLNFEKSIEKLKEISEKIEKNKEELKMNIQKIFTKLRNELNEREDKMILEVENKFEEMFLSKNIIKNNEKLPNKIKESLEKGKLIKDKWNNDKLSFSINICLNIEKNIKDINKINESINKNNSFEEEIKLYPNENEINDILENIKKFDIFKEEKNMLGKLLNNKDLEIIENWIKSDNPNIKDIKFNLCYDAKIMEMI